MRGRGFGPWRREFRSFLELFALSGITVAQPTFDLLTNNAELLVALRTTRLEAIAFVVLVLLVPPTVLWIVEVLVGLALPSARRIAHAVVAAGIVAVLAAEVLKHQTDLTPRSVLGAALVAGATAGFLLVHFEVVSLWLRFLALVPLAFGVLFLASGNVANAVFDGGPPAASPDIGHPRRVVMVVLDELPLASLLDGTGRIDASLFPNIAALAADATWYRNTSTVAPDTEHAVPAIVTGELPDDPEALPTASVYPRSLFTLLGDTYDRNVHEGVTQLCPRDLCPTPVVTTRRHGLATLVHDSAVLWRRFATPGSGDDQISFDASTFAGSAAPGGEAFVRSLEPDSGPRLDYLHLLLPHQPWHLRAGERDDGQKRPPRGIAFVEWATQASAQAARQRHLLQLQATDELIGDMVAKLRRIGAYRDSLVVLTADHGIAFTGSLPERGVTPTTYPQILWTPLLVKAARQEGARVDDRPAQSIDVLPTIADLLDVRVPWPIDGRSLLGAPRPEGARPVFDWKANRMRPAEGRRYLEVDGAAGFASVLRSSASTATGEPDLRLYRLGAYGNLVGRRTEPLVSAGASRAVGTIASRSDFDHVDADAPEIPWAYVQGSVRAPPSHALVVAVNGVVAGTATTLPRSPGSARSSYWATLQPRYFVDGHNDVRLYLVSGSPADPRLAPVQVRG